MKNVAVRLFVGGILLLAAIYSLKHAPPSLKLLSGLAGAEQESDDGQQSQSSEAQSGPATVIGPLANLIQQKSSSETAAQSRLRKAHPSDHIEDSPVGTSSAIVSKTFVLATTAKFAFQVPPHAVGAQLRGSYRSFLRRADAQTDDDSADVEFLLMNEPQYQAFRHGGPEEVVFSVESSHDQDVNFAFPATQKQPVNYYLIFRNNPGRAPRKIVQADLRVDF